MNSKELTNLKETVALANRTLHHYGLATYLGQASMRIPDTDQFLIKPGRPVSMDCITADMILTADFEGNLLDAQDGSALPDEWPLHTEIYKARPNVGGVVHTHQKWCTVFGIAGQTILPVQHPPSASAVVPPYPIFEEAYDNSTAAKNAGRISRVLGDSVGCHLRNHGMVFVGVSVQAALKVAISAEHEAEMNWLAMQVGAREQIPMNHLQEFVQNRFVSKEDERRDGVARDAWSNAVRADQDRELMRFRLVQL